MTKRLNAALAAVGAKPFKLRNRYVQREKMTQNAIVDFLTLYGVFAWVTFQPHFHGKSSGQWKYWHRSSAGVPDVLGIFEGKPLAIEVKRRGGKKPTANQEAFLKRFRDNGGIAFVAFDISDVARELNLASDKFKPGVRS